MNGSLRLGTPSACAHSSSFAPSFVAMMVLGLVNVNKENVSPRDFVARESSRAALSVDSASAFLNGASGC
jgi:hypothetical protein